MDETKTPNRKASLVFGMAATLIGGVLLYLAFGGILNDESGGIADVLGIVLFGWGIANLLWTVEKSLRGIGAPLMLLIGLFIMVAAAVSGQLIFAIVGGFMAVIGGMFFLKK